VKKFLIIVLALIIGGAGGYFLYSKYFKNNVNNNTSNNRKVTAENYKEPFMWGVNVNPSALRNYSLEGWNKQLKYVNELGTSWIRLSFDNEPKNKFEIYDDMMKVTDERKINIYLGLGSSKPIETIDNPYQDGYKVADEISAHYKGKIKYYQLMSEQGSGALKGATYSGENESDYDSAKYNRIKEWLRGASTAIRKNDPNTYIVITDQWLRTAYFQMLINDKIDFDIIGWDWFGDMGLMEDKKLADGTLLIDKLKSFNKPLILAEVNGRPDSKKGMDETKQSDFIQKMAEWAYNSGYIKGFFIHELVDLRPKDDNKYGDYYGLIEYQKASDGGYTFGKKRQAFETYISIIKKYSQ